MQLQEQIEKMGNQVNNGIRMVQEDQMRKTVSSPANVSDKVEK